MTDTPTAPAPDEAMLAGMEGLIAAMKDREPAPAPNVGLASTLLPSGRGGGSLSDAPWEAVDLDTDAPAPPLARGTVIDRYVVLQRLGAGAMGVVYAAYDPELDRKVAIKLLLPGAGGASSRTRQLREAQTLARLSHPNVVAIHDVGTMGEQVWLAMELVQGQTLRQWLATARSWREVVKVMRDAGEGLAAAHAAELLHRDFKPDNVMLDDDGRVRVMDFGLARAQSGATPEPGSAEISPTLDALSLAVTRAGAVLGTPGYMAAEQFDGKELTPAADQFAFCVTLWEALYGERPFAGNTWVQLAANVLAGRRRPPPKGRRVPAWLRRACERGLALAPGERWPSMRALLDVLATGRTRARLRQGVVMLGVIALVGVGVEARERWNVARRTAACKATGDEIAAAWSSERAQALREALVATGSSLALTTADKVVPWLDAQAQSWREARVEACLDTEVRGRWDADVLERSLWCLDERRTELESLVDELMRPDAELLQKAVPAAAELSAVAPCRDTRVLEALPLPTTADHEAIRAVRASVARASSLQLMGRHTEGLALARNALAQAEQLGWQPLSAAARVRVGMLLSETGAYAEAESMLEDGYFEASEGVAPYEVFNAASGLVQVVGVQAARHGDGLRWGRLAEVAGSALPGDDRLRRLELAMQRANVHNVAGKHEEAESLYEQALALAEATLGPVHPYTATVLNNLAQLLTVTGAHDRALAAALRGLAIREQALGPDHPLIASSLNALAVIQHHRGDFEATRASLERAVAIKEEALGADHPDVGLILNNLALLHHATGDHETARSMLERTLAIYEQRLPSEHPSVAGALQNLAMVCAATGRFDRARQLYERAIAILEKTLGPENTNLAMTLGNLAVVHLDQGDHVRAKALQERALAIYEQSLDAEHHLVAKARSNLGDILWGTGAYDEAEGLYERAFAVLDRTQGPDHLDTAQITGRMARSLRRRGDLDQAEALYRRMLSTYEQALGPDHPDLGEPLTSLAELALDRGRTAEALALAQRAVDVRERGSALPVMLAEARRVLARALWDAPPDAGRDRPRALTLARQARDALRDTGASGSQDLAAVEAWLREHGDTG